MRTETPHAIYLKDYTPPAWLIDTVDLHVAIHDGHAEVRARLVCRRNPANPQADLVLTARSSRCRKSALAVRRWRHRAIPWTTRR
jgi:aminopeptidase N